jgi:hypothetical protein
MNDLSDRKKAMLQVHCVDYQVMVARISRFIGLQFVVWPVLVTFLTFVLVEFLKERPQSQHLSFLWAAALATNLAVQTYYFALHEVYTHVGYIETTLKPRVAIQIGLASFGVLGRDSGLTSFWSWEQYLRKKGKAYDALWGDLFPTLFSVVAVLSPLYLYTGVWSGWDFAALMVDGLFLRGICGTALRIVRARTVFGHVNYQKIIFAALSLWIIILLITSPRWSSALPYVASDLMEQTKSLTAQWICRPIIESKVPFCD